MATTMCLPLPQCSILCYTCHIRSWGLFRLTTVRPKIFNSKLANSTHLFRISFFSSLGFLQMLRCLYQFRHDGQLFQSLPVAGHSIAGSGLSVCRCLLVAHWQVRPKKEWQIHNSNNVFLYLSQLVGRVCPVRVWLTAALCLRDKVNQLSL